MPPAPSNGSGGILLQAMHVRVLPFGISKDWLGAAPMAVELPEGALVADLLRALAARLAGRAELLRAIAVSVNAEYATADHLLRDGDEVGLLPPVSGGSAAGDAELPSVVALTGEPIDAQKLVTKAKRGGDGAAVVFDGIVRDNTRGRKTLHLDYEAYEEMALKQMKQLAQQARRSSACGM